ncbi:MAG: MAP kinase phosphatase 6 [Monoraphidium minutum]|nr:MAG: MAP kinase phosphatase 6 [Monoraphidium minutum]
MLAAARPRAISARSGPAAAAPASLPPLPPLDAAYEAAAAFSAYASWLVPGALLLGRYPFVAPPHCARHEQGEAQIEAILSAGPHVFVSLEAELPPQGRMPIGGQGGVMPYKAVVELVAAAHTPTPPGAVVNGVRHPILDKFLPARRKAQAQEVVDYYEAERVAFEHWPLEAGAAPPPERLSEAAAALAGRLGRGERLYLHSGSGGGRAAAVGACVLAAAYGLSAEEALQRVQRAHAARAAAPGAAPGDGAGAAPESTALREAVEAFVAARGGK